MLKLLVKNNKAYFTTMDSAVRDNFKILLDNLKLLYETGEETKGEFIIPTWDKVRSEIILYMESKAAGVRGIHRVDSFAQAQQDIIDWNNGTPILIETEQGAESYTQSISIVGDRISFLPNQGFENIFVPEIITIQSVNGVDNMIMTSSNNIILEALKRTQDDLNYVTTTKMDKIDGLHNNKTSGSTAMAPGYTPTEPMDVATRKFVIEEGIALGNNVDASLGLVQQQLDYNTVTIDALVLNKIDKNGAIHMDPGYVPIDHNQVSNKKYVDDKVIAEATTRAAVDALLSNDIEDIKNALSGGQAINVGVGKATWVSNVWDPAHVGASAPLSIGVNVSPFERSIDLSTISYAPGYKFKFIDKFANTRITVDYQIQGSAVRRAFAFNAYPTGFYVTDGDSKTDDIFSHKIDSNGIMTLKVESSGSDQINIDSLRLIFVQQEKATLIGEIATKAEVDEKQNINANNLTTINKQIVPAINEINDKTNNSMLRNASNNTIPSVGAGNAHYLVGRNTATGALNFAAINTGSASQPPLISNLQWQRSDSLNTTSDSIVGAINELDTNVKDNRADIDIIKNQAGGTLVMTGKNWTQAEIFTYVSTYFTYANDLTNGRDRGRIVSIRTSNNQYFAGEFAGYLSSTQMLFKGLTTPDANNSTGQVRMVRLVANQGVNSAPIESKNKIVGAQAQYGEEMPTLQQVTNVLTAADNAVLARSQYMIGEVKGMVIAPTNTNWLELNGQAIPAKYTDLIAIFGANLPNLGAGYGLVGASSSIGSLTNGSVIAHNHTATTNVASGGSHVHQMGIRASGSWAINGYATISSATGVSTTGGARTESPYTSSEGAHPHTATTTVNSTGGTQNFAAGLRVRYFVYGGEK